MKRRFMFAVLLGGVLLTRSNAEPLARPDPTASLSDMSIGAPSAGVTIIEYGSMTCVHCAAFQNEVFPKLRFDFIETGKVKFVFREFPLEVKAAAGSMIARCASKDDSKTYFDIIDILFERQSDWAFDRSPAGLQSIAKQVGLSEAVFKSCLSNNDLLNKLNEARQFAIDKLGVNSTPSFFINGRRFEGEPTYEGLAEAIRQEILE